MFRNLSLLCATLSADGRSQLAIGEGRLFRPEQLIDGLEWKLPRKMSCFHFSLYSLAEL